MSNATKCDRCGGYFEKGGSSIRKGCGYMAKEYDLCPDCAESFDAWLERGQMADASERVTNKGEMLHDTREQLEADVDTALYGASMADDGYISLEMAIGWLDRQAAITERECMERSTSERIGFDCAECAEGLGRELDARCDPLKARIAELKAEIATLKEHRAGNVERLHELTDECAELRKYRDEWKGIAEAAWAECEGYRAKLGDVLDAIHAGERAAR